MSTSEIQTELLTRLQSTGREGMTETIAYIAMVLLLIGVIAIITLQIKKRKTEDI